jgi:hypothetical protein
MSDLSPFASYESKVKSAIENSDVPYVGLIDEILITEEMHFVEKSITKYGGHIQKFERGLRHAPALFVTYLSTSIRKNLGANTSAIYGCINMAVGKPVEAKQTSDDRSRLWKAFRVACKKLGLPISNRCFGPNFMVDAYLEQAGIPEANLPELEKRMELYAKKHGLPEVDDVTAEQAWYSSFKKSLKPPFSKRSIRALENDTTGYYLNRFLEEKRKITDSGSEQYTIAYSVNLMFVEDELKIVIPALSVEKTWTINVDGTIETVNVQEADFQFLIEDVGSRNIIVECDEQRFEYHLWNSEKDNQLAIFRADNGHFVSSHFLTEEGEAFPPGKYIIISRFEFTSNEIELTEYFQDGFYIGDFEIKPDTQIIIKRGPVNFAILSHAEPSISFEGTLIKPHTGKDFYCSKGIELITNIPKEWLSSEHSFELEISSNSDTPNIVINLKSDAMNQVSCFDYRAACWAPGLKRIVVKLKRGGSSRVLSRLSALVWCGLDAITDGYKFHISELPAEDNFNIDKSSNVRRDVKNKKLVAIDNDLPHMDICFNFTAKNSQVFRFALQGTFLYISDLKDGFRQEKILSLGATLASNYNDSRRVRIYSSENPTLEIGENTLHDFAKKRWYKTSIASLLDKVDRSNNELVANYGNAEQVLLKLVSPHYIENWTIEQKTQTVEVIFETPVGVSEMEIVATNLLTLSEEKIYVGSLNGRSNYRQDGLSATLFHHDKSSKKQILSVDVSGGEDGPWLLEFTASVDGKWGRFSNKRKDHFSVGFVCASGHLINLGNDYFTKLREFNSEHLIDLFALLTKRLNRCFEVNSWNSLEWIKGIWMFMLNYIGGIESSNTVIRLTAYQASEEDSQSWVPQVSLGAYSNNIYSGCFDNYRKLDAQNSTRLKTLKLAGEINQSLLNAIKTEKLALAVTVFFANRSEYADPNSEVEPVEFNYEQYIQSIPYLFSESDFDKLKRGDIKPAYGDLLGGNHYAYSQLRFIENEKSAQEGNDYIRPHFNTLVIKVARELGESVPVLLPDHYFGHHDYLKELLDAVCKFSSYLAKSYRAAHWEKEDIFKVLDRLQQQAGATADIKSLLSYFFNVCGDIFHFYLLLWEVYFVSESNNKKGSLANV